MATVSVNKGIVNSWSLREFRALKGKMLSGNFTNSLSKENFNSLVFESPVDRSLTFVSYSSNLGELTKDELRNMRDELQVVELSSGTFKLCKRGENSFDDMDDIFD